MLLRTPAQAPLPFPFLITSHVSPVPQGQGAAAVGPPKLTVQYLLSVAQGGEQWRSLCSPCCTAGPGFTQQSEAEHSQVEQPCCSPWRGAIFVLPFAERW